MIHFLYIFSPLLLTFFSISSTHVHATQITITNNCPYTVWAAAIPGGGQRVTRGQSWTISANPGQTGPASGPIQAAPRPGLTGTTSGASPYSSSTTEGFNVPMRFSPTTAGACKGITCNADVVGQCPAVLVTDGGCNIPCTVFKTNEYCCNSGSCGPKDYSRHFKELCPDAYSYPKDDATSTFTCPTGTDTRSRFVPVTLLFPFLLMIRLC